MFGDLREMFVLWGWNGKKVKKFLENDNNILDESLLGFFCLKICGGKRKKLIFWF